MKVEAIDVGFYGGRLRAIGEEFDVRKGAKGKWFVPAGKAKADKPAEVVDDNPRTLSEMASKEPTAKGNNLV